MINQYSAPQLSAEILTTAFSFHTFIHSDSDSSGHRLWSSVLLGKTCQYLVESGNHQFIIQLTVDIGIFLKGKSSVSQGLKAWKKRREVVVHPLDDRAIEVPHVAQLQAAHMHI